MYPAKKAPVSVPASVAESDHARASSGSSAGTAEKPSMPKISALQSMAVMRGALGGADVGLGKIVAFVEQGLARDRRERIGEAVAEIQSRGMPAFAKAAKGF